MSAHPTFPEHVGDPRSLAVEPGRWRFDFAEVAPSVVLARREISSIKHDAGLDLDDKRAVLSKLRQSGADILLDEDGESPDLRGSTGIPHLLRQGGRVARWTQRYLVPFRAREKIRNHLGPLVAHAAQHHGLLAPASHSTLTGRLTLLDPALHSVPREHHALISPADPAMRIVGADWASVELRLMAWMSADVAMRESVLCGSDPLSLVADKCGCERSVAKKVSYGLAYGAGMDRLAAILTASGTPTSTKQAELIVSSIERQWPQWADWRRAVREETARTRLVTTPYGSEIACPKPHKAVNYLVQATGANLLRSAVEQLRHDGFEPALTWHDAIYLQVPRSGVESAVSVLEDVMTRPPSWADSNLLLAAEAQVAISLAK